MSEPSYSQSDFRGGMNLRDQDISLAPNEYALAFNVRNRTTALETVKKPLKDTSAPLGLKQGIYAFDKYILLFCNGAAYYKNILTNSGWIKINDILLDPSVPYVYTEVVPASRLNYVKKLKTSGQISGTSLDDSTAITNITTAGSSAGVVVQDGVYPPWIIFPDATARRIQSYSQWSNQGTREYVPIMKQMKYVDGILFGISPDGKKLYRSVSGRPLDFVVNIDIQGNKGGDADTTAYAVSYNPITCLTSLSSGDLFLATTKTCYPVELNYDVTIFGEPTFRNRKPFNAGVINQFSFIDTLGDYCFIDIDGIRSFNAVNSQQNEGRNSIFSRNIGPVLARKQDVSASIVHDNYAFFAIKTVGYGYCIAIADLTRTKIDELSNTISPSWVGLDRFSELDGAIKQFAVADQSENPTLYGITDDSVYLLYGAAETAESSVDFKAVTSGKADTELKLEGIRGVFDYSFTESNATATQILNNKPKNFVLERLAVDADETYGGLDNILFNFSRISGQGWKIKPRIQWSNEAKLQMLEVDVTLKTSKTNVRQSANTYNS